MTKFYTLLLMTFMSLPLFADTIVVTDADLTKDSDVTWTSNNEYHLDGYVFLEEGGKLTIEPGTVIKGLSNPSDGSQASALIITRGAQIFAEGTSTSPIIFTAEIDDLSKPNDLSSDEKGLWGGIIILGYGVVGVDGGTENIEGIPSTEGRATYGGTNNEDNSGVLKFVSIRHGGSVLEANNEINGLTLGGVGSGTKIEFVEVYANKDDGIEWFGGAVSVKHAVVSFCGDDSYDYDQSWAGKGQFWVSLQDKNGNRAGEWDGSEASDLKPDAIVSVANLTFIGAGESSVNEDGNDALRIRDAAAAKVYNSIFMDFDGRAVRMDADFAGDAYDRLKAGDSEFKGNYYHNFTKGSTFADITKVKGDFIGADATLLEKALADNNNTIGDAGVASISRMPNGELDPRLNAGSPGLSAAVDVEDDFFDKVNFVGAFGNSNNWAKGWTALDAMGYFGDKVQFGKEITVTDNDLKANTETTWKAENTYILDGYVFLEEGGVLTIEPGTVIKAKSVPTDGSKASALIITRGAKIIADANAQNPIIFTSELDDIANKDDLTNANKGLWGGLIILGKGIVGVDGGTENIEGIPSLENRAKYGGNDNTDNSGILRYVSIRYGGSVLEANNEINGLTLGGVGSGTTIEYVEVYANKDDGIEWFGGAVNVKYAVVSFCGDDSFDFDQSWAGNGQFWFSLQDENGNRAGEWDGSEASDLTPKAVVTVANATFIGAGEETVNEDGNDALRIRDAAAAKVYNSIFTDFAGHAIRMDNDFEGDSYDRLKEGDITFAGNIYHNIKAGSTLEDIAKVKGKLGNDKTDLVNILKDAANANQVADPLMGGISREANNKLDPRVAAGVALYDAVPVEGDYFDKVSFKGAFDNTNNWALNWTALDQNGYFGNLVQTGNKNTEVVSLLVYPNPTADFVNLTFDLSTKANVTIEVRNVLGQTVQTVAVAGNAGANQVNVDLSALNAGNYFMTVRSNGSMVATTKVVKN